MSFWLAAAGLYGIASGVGYREPWAILAFWTRVHAVIFAGAGLLMLLGAIGLLVFRGRLRWLVWGSAGAAALFGTSLIAGTLLGAIPCEGPT